MQKLAGFNHNQTAVRSMQEIEAGTEEALRQAAASSNASKHNPIRIMKDLDVSDAVKDLANSAKEVADGIEGSIKSAASTLTSTAEAAAQRSADAVKKAAHQASGHFSDTPRNQPHAEVVDDAEKLQRNIAAALWIATIAFSVVPGLLVLLTRSDNIYLRAQAQEAINWAATLLVGGAICSLLTVIFIGMPLMFLLGIAHIAFCVMGVQAALGGKRYRVPMSWRLLWD